MSMSLMVQAMKARVGNPLRKLVLIKLADNASDSGECWPAVATIAFECEISERSVQNHMCALKSVEGQTALIVPTSTICPLIMTVQILHPIRTGAFLRVQMLHPMVHLLHPRVQMVQGGRVHLLHPEPVSY